MKKNRILFFASASFILMGGIASCSDDKEPQGGHEDWASISLNLEDLPESMFGGPTSYGANLYYGYPEQITGVLLPGFSFYIQLPINYGYTYDQDFNPVYGYSFYNGGIALSNWHDMEDASYTNQLSVYSQSSPSGGNFLVAFGNSSVTEPSTAKFSDYDGCAHIFLTNKDGYTVSNPGEPNPILTGGEPTTRETYFDSIEVANTTYTYLTMKEGNAYCEPFNTDNKGWFKVQFIAFDSADPDAQPVGYVESYLANFDYQLTQESGLNRKIRDDWYRVDLSSLPKATILVVNFVGSDMGEYGLNTPSYCALDQLGITYW